MSVEEQNANRGCYRYGDEEPENTAQVPTHDERDDDQHGTEVNRVAKHLG